jgi:hypothetical protein
VNTQQNIEIDIRLDDLKQNKIDSAVAARQGLEPRACGLWFCDLSQILARAEAHDPAGPTSQICVRLLN